MCFYHVNKLNVGIIHLRRNFVFLSCMYSYVFERRLRIFRKLWAEMTNYKDDAKRLHYAAAIFGQRAGENNKERKKEKDVVLCAGTRAIIKTKCADKNHMKRFEMHPLLKSIFMFTCIIFVNKIARIVKMDSNASKVQGCIQCLLIFIFTDLK